jgi:plastocyanin
MARAPFLLFLLHGAALAATVRGTVTLPEVKGDPPSGHWRVENGVLPVLPRLADLHGEALVVLESPTAKKLDPPPAIVVELHGLRMDPSVVAVQTGGTVTFKNSDRVPHALYIEGGATLMPPSPTPSGQSRAQRFLAAGEYRIRDEEQPHLDGTVVALDTPYAAAVDEHGAWKLEVPEGHYTLRVFWRGAWVLTRPLEVGHLPAEIALHIPEKGRAE